ncbi:universal stress protein [Fodinicurvata sp. EGI_FJ10296]|uniref:universal stress protein n=1 Tax=Fodinicurvata sp. EGI_FJ10296 TaxID=3231908 RepID=UPI00345245A9
MTDKIIALVDGSIYSKSVCENAAWIAGRTDAAIELFHVLGRREAAGASDLSGSIALGARTALLEELSSLDEQRGRLAQKRGRAILDDAEALLKSSGMETVTTRLRNGDLLETVSEFETGADMIVIGKRGEAADFAKLHLGSNLERIVRAAKKPIFVVARAFRPIKRVLVAYDGGVSAMKAVDHIARNRLFSGLDITVLSVGQDTDEGRKRLEDARLTLTAGGHEATTDLVPGQPETVISKKVESEGFDLLVMGAYGHSRVRSLIIGSTTTEMVRSCKIPILLFR